MQMVDIIGLAFGLLMMATLIILFRKFWQSKKLKVKLQQKVTVKNGEIAALAYTCQFNLLEYEYIWHLLNRLKGVSSHHIGCHKTALDNTPKVSNLRKEYVQHHQLLEQSLVWQKEIVDKIQYLNVNDDSFSVPYKTRIRDMHYFKKNPTPRECLLKDYVKSLPVETLFWYDGDEHHLKKLKKHFNRLQRKYHQASECQLKAAMMYLFNQKKENPTELKFNYIDNMVKQLLSQDTASSNAQH